MSKRGVPQVPTKTLSKDVFRREEVLHTSLGSRLFLARLFLGKPQREMGKLFGFSLAAYGHLERGINFPKVHIFQSLARDYRINLTWLIAGHTAEEKPILGQAIFHQDLVQQHWSAFYSKYGLSTEPRRVAQDNGVPFEWVRWYYENLPGPSQRQEVKREGSL